MENKNMLFGLRPIIEAIEAGRQIEKVYLKKGADGVLLGELAELCRQRRIRVQWVPVEKLNRLAQGNHQGAVALTASIEYVGLHELLESIPGDETPLLVVLDGVTDVRNFGAIARSAECAGAHGLVTSLKSSAPVNAESMKSSAGALSLIPVCRAGSIRGTLKIIAERGVPDRRRNRKKRRTAVRGRPERPDRDRDGERGHGNIEGSAQVVRYAAGHTDSRQRRIVERVGRSGRHAVRGRTPADRDKPVRRIAGRYLSEKSRAPDMPVGRTRCLPLQAEADRFETGQDLVFRSATV